MHPGLFKERQMHGLQLQSSKLRIVRIRKRTGAD
jgi:hypothetical protein